MPSGRKRHLPRYALCSFLGIIPLTSELAAGLEVNPIRVTLSGPNAAAAITLQNTGQEPKVIQVEVLRWDQEHGDDLYTPTRELLVNPPIFTIEPGEAQIVRVGLNRPPDPRSELAYRLYLQEVPSKPEGEPGTLRVALRLGLPVFVLPAAAPEARLNWQAARTAEGAIRLSLTNGGNVHARILSFQLLLPFDGDPVVVTEPVHRYVLPGRETYWIVPVEGRWDGRRFQLVAQTARGEVRIELELDSR